MNRRTITLILILALAVVCGGASRGLRRTGKSPSARNVAMTSIRVNTLGYIVKYG